LTYNLKTDWPLKAGDPADLNAEFDSPATVEKISEALSWGGHQVKKIGHVYNLLEQIKDLDVDIVFNICEGYSGRNRESQVPLLLELYGIPFVGSDALTLGLTLDKIIAKKCFMADGIPTPAFFEAGSTDNLEQLVRQVKFPLIVKCRYEGTSKGLTEHSKVNDLKSLKQQVEIIVRTYHQPAIVEEFIRGSEFTVAVLGNDDPQAMPVAQIVMNDRTDLGDNFYTFAMVVSSDLRYTCPAKISEKLNRQLQEISVRAYQSVDCRDFGRVDFRVDEKGNPYVLEINPLPSLAAADIFNIFPAVCGSTYEKIVNQILENAFKRYNDIDSLKAKRKDCCNVPR